jgi:hypothetical protein
MALGLTEKVLALSTNLASGFFSTSFLGLPIELSLTVLDLSWSKVFLP